MTDETDISHDLKIDLSKDGRETFIPIRHNELVDRLQVWAAMDQSQIASFRDLCGRLQSIFHAEHFAALLQMEELYYPLDPDSELLQAESVSQEELANRTEVFFDRLAAIAYAAHYQRLGRDELERMIKLGSQGGVRLEVDFHVFEKLEIFARGYRMVDVKRRRWQNFFREETHKLPEFHRLILVFRLKPESLEELEEVPEPIEDESESTDEESKNDGRSKKKKRKRNVDKSMRSDAIYIKNFKNIPETDLEVLLPGTRVKLSTLDRGKIILPTLTGAALKVAPAIYRMVFVFFTLTLVNILETFLVVGAVMIGYIVKSVFAYFRTKDKYQFNLTRNLYLKNLDNNAGVLYRVLNEAQEQELCETILGYAVLLKYGSTDGVEEKQLDKLAEAFLLEETQLDVDFDLHDALGKLARLGLATVDAGGLWKPVAIDSAAKSLSQNWERLFTMRSKMLDNRNSPDDDGNLLTS